MAISITLRVTPEELKTQKNVVQTDLDNMRNDILNITREIMETSHYWHGEAGDKQRKEYEEGTQNITNMINRLQTYPDRILKMAGLYEMAEETNASTANQLKTDIQMV